MGVHNRISENKYNAMKRVTKVPADDANTMRAFGVGASTCRNVRNTANYQEYCERVFRYHGHPHGKTVKPRYIPVNPEAIAPIIRPQKEPESRMLGIVLLFGCVVLSSVFTIWLVWFIVNFLGGQQ